MSWQLSSEKTQDRFPWKFIEEEITEYDFCYSNCSVLTLPVFWLFAGSQTVARPHWPTNWEPTSLGAAQSVRTLTSWFVKTFSGSRQLLILNYHKYKHTSAWPYSRLFNVIVLYCLLIIACSEAYIIITFPLHASQEPPDPRLTPIPELDHYNFDGLYS